MKKLLLSGLIALMPVVAFSEEAKPVPAPAAQSQSQTQKPAVKGKVAKNSKKKNLKSAAAASTEVPKTETK